VDGGVLSNWLHDTVRSGDVLTAMPPSGGFTVNVDPAVSRHIGLVAGGVGITPLMSMAETVLRTEPLSRVTLLYGNRSEHEIIFRNRLDALVQLFAGRLVVQIALEALPPVWKGIHGVLDGEAVSRAIDTRSPDAWYLCGPPAMMDSVTGALRSAGVDAERIHIERFQYAEAGKLQAPSSNGTVVFAKSNVTSPPATGTTILEAAEKAGVSLPSSCRMGGCGACKVKVEGRVTHAEPNCLTDRERAEGYALACCSYADGRVVLPGF
jgi:ferredoxin-NADP reductase